MTQDRKSQGSELFVVDNELVAFPQKTHQDAAYDTEPLPVPKAAETAERLYDSIDETQREELMAEILDLFESCEAREGLKRAEAAFSSRCDPSMSTDATF